MTYTDTSILLAGNPVPQTREQVREMDRVATTDDQRDGIELFTALAEYLDELCGPDGFTELLPRNRRDQLASRISAVLADSDTRADRDEPPIRLDQPINAAVTLEEGFGLARRLTRGTGWQITLGIALLGLYDYLDQLHPDGFRRMLNSRERAQVAAQAQTED